MDGASFSARAGGNIAPCRFVKQSDDGFGSLRFTQCGNNEAPAGISPKWTRRMAVPGWDDGFCAIAGEHLGIHGPGDDEAMLELAGTVAAGAFIKSDADGKGVASSTDKDHVGAIAKFAGAAGDVISVKPIRHDLAA